MTIHFSQSDDRFCGDKSSGRQFSTNPNRVTCPCCASNDRFVLSAEAQAYVDSLQVSL